MFMVANIGPVRVNVLDTRQKSKLYSPLHQAKCLWYGFSC